MLQSGKNPYKKRPQAVDKHNLPAVFFFCPIRAFFLLSKRIFDICVEYYIVRNILEVYYAKRK
jgi:hypothetical protein